MATKTGKGGRPSRAPGEKMTRLSVMMRPRFRDALEIIARDRQTSLSQALEYVIAVVARTYKIEGKTVLDIVVPVTDGDIPRGDWPDVPAPLKELAYLEFTRDPQSQSEEAKREQEAASVSRKVLTMPASLRRPDETFFVEVYDRLKFPAEAIDWHAMDSIYEACRAAFQVGLKVEDVLKAIKESVEARQAKKD